MQQHQKRVGLTEGDRFVTVYTEDGKNREGLDSFSVIHFPGAPCLALQRGGGDSLPYLVKTAEEIRLLHEATGEILRRLDEDSKTE